MNKVKEFYYLLEPLLSLVGPTYIAGGAVRDVLLGNKPRDYDVFVLTTPDKKEWAENSIREIIRKNNIGNVNANGNVNAKIDEIESVQDEDYKKSEQKPLLNTSIGGEKIQIMLSFEKDVYSLVSKFDWNVCLFAYGYLPNRKEVDYYYITALEDIGSNKPLKLNNDHSPYSALRRGYRFSERYNMKLEVETVRSLCRKIISEKDNKDQEKQDLVKEVVNAVNF